MTQEEKARAYDEALERAKSFQQKFGGDYAGYIFPELRESEDERIRKELINFILYKAKGVSEEQEHSWVVYLEKQKEQKPAEWSNEDEEMLKYVIDNVNDAKQLFASKEAVDLCDKEITWLKSLRHSWKPSEEQMLKEAAEGRISSCGLHNAIFFKDQKWTDMLDKYKEGDKVRVIVLPKEDQTNG